MPTFEVTVRRRSDARAASPLTSRAMTSLPRPALNSVTAVAMSSIPNAPAAGPAMSSLTNVTSAVSGSRLSPLSGR